MALANPRQLLHQASLAGTVVPAFNIDSPEMFLGVLDASCDADVPVIIQVTAETLGLWGWESLSAWLLTTIGQADIDVALMLDHSTQVTDITRAIELGFTGVMFDGSARPLAENIRVTATVIEAAAPSGCFVEGEVGHVSRDGEPPHWEHLTTVEEALSYYDATHVDALAVAVGTKHGHYRAAEDMDFGRLREIHEAVRTPLVLHGGSGLPADVLSQLSSLGITKVNIGTALRRAWWKTVSAHTDLKPREALTMARQAVSLRCRDIMGSLGARKSL